MSTASRSVGMLSLPPEIRQLVFFYVIHPPIYSWEGMSWYARHGLRTIKSLYSVCNTYREEMVYVLHKHVQIAEAMLQNDLTSWFTTGLVTQCGRSLTPLHERQMLDRWQAELCAIEDTSMNTNP